MTDNQKFTLAALLAMTLILVGIRFEFSNAAPPFEESDLPTMLIFKSKAITTSRVITVGDVAQIVGGSPTMRAKIAALDLAELEPGQSTTVKRKQVEFRLKIAEISTRSIEFKGDSECVVNLDRIFVAKDEIWECVKQTIYRRLTWKPEEVVVSLVQPIVANLPQIAQDDQVTFKAEPQTNTVNLGRVQINVTILVNGERKMSLPVYCEVKLLQTVAVLKRPLNRGDVILAEAIAIESKGIEPNQKPADPTIVIGRKLKRAIGAGAIIQANDLEEETISPTGNTSVLVKANKPVKMVVHLGAIDVIANGEALMDGKMGDKIKVRNLDSKKIITARVTDYGTVVVE